LVVEDLGDNHFVIGQRGRALLRGHRKASVIKAWVSYVNTSVNDSDLNAVIRGARYLASILAPAETRKHCEGVNQIKVWVGKIGIINALVLDVFHLRRLFDG